MDIADNHEGRVPSEHTRDHLPDLTETTMQSLRTAFNMDTILGLDERIETTRDTALENLADINPTFVQEMGKALGSILPSQLNAYANGLSAILYAYDLQSDGALFEGIGRLKPSEISHHVEAIKSRFVTDGQDDPFQRALHRPRLPIENINLRTFADTCVNSATDFSKPSIKKGILMGYEFIRRSGIPVTPHHEPPQQQQE